MTLFDIVNPEDSPIDDELSKQELINKENIEAFKPLVLRFCEVMGLAVEVLSDTVVIVFEGILEGVTKIHVDLAFLRLVNEDTGERRSVHSSKLEPELFSMLWPDISLPHGFFEVFPPFMFTPKMD